MSGIRRRTSIEFLAISDCHLVVQGFLNRRHRADTGCALWTRGGSLPPIEACDRKVTGISRDDKLPIPADATRASIVATLPIIEQCACTKIEGIEFSCRFSILVLRLDGGPWHLLVVEKWQCPRMCELDRGKRKAKAYDCLPKQW